MRTHCESFDVVKLLRIPAQEMVVPMLANPNVTNNIMIMILKIFVKQKPHFGHSETFLLPPGGDCSRVIWVIATRVIVEISRTKT